MERRETDRTDPLEAASFHPWTQNKIKTENVPTLPDLSNSGTGEKKYKDVKQVNYIFEERAALFFAAVKTSYY
jgi:hypothetical protein